MVIARAIDVFKLEMKTLHNKQQSLSSLISTKRCCNFGNGLKRSWSHQAWLLQSFPIWILTIKDSLSTTPTSGNKTFGFLICCDNLVILSFRFLASWKYSSVEIAVVSAIDFRSYYISLTTFPSLTQSRSDRSCLYASRKFISSYLHVRSIPSWISNSSSETPNSSVRHCAIAPTNTPNISLNNSRFDFPIYYYSAQLI